MSAWLRWILVLPAAIGAYLGVWWVFFRTVQTGEYWIIDWLGITKEYNDVIGTCCCSYFGILAGAEVAPKFKLGVGVFLMCVLSILAGIVFGKFLWRGEVNREGWWIVASIVGGLVASGGACYQVYKASNRNSSK